MTVISPSKKFLYKKLQIFLKEYKNKKIGIDLASENFKNSDFFKTRIYIGVDIRKNIIKQGLKKQNDIQKIGLQKDLTKSNSIGKNFADVAVSTNTIYQFRNCNDRFKAIKNFVEFVKPNGGLFLQMEKRHLNKQIMNKIDSSFKSSRIIYYHNFLSETYIRLLGGKKLVRNKFAIFFDKIKIGYFLFLLEIILRNFSPINSKLIIICYKKKNFKNSKFQLLRKQFIYK